MISEPRPGTQFGHYRVDEPLGVGGMGVVYRGYDTKLHRIVAIKLLSDSSDPTSHARLLIEARAASALNHPNVCTIYAVAEADGQAGIVMEYVPGEPLSRMLASGNLPSDTAAGYGSQIADALDHAHEQGVVHRDLKSANIMVTPTGRVKVLDFGLARLLPEHVASGITHTGTPFDDWAAIAGTVAYMAPEVIAGEAGDTRSDIWALGVVLYEMVCGALPFQGGTIVQLAEAIVTEPPRPIPAAVPASLRRIIQQCLAKDPAGRFQRAADVRAALDGVQASTRQPPPAAVGIAGALLVVLAAGLIYWQPLSRPGAPDTPRGTPVSSVAARRSVAVLGFKNISGDTPDRWIATALSEMLTTELAAGAALRTVPGENVARMKKELALAEAESYAADTLARIRSNLGTDLVVAGSYAAVGSVVRFDVRLQDARRGDTIASVAEEGSERELFALVSRIGARLRERLDVAVLSAAESASVRASLPSQPDAARPYIEGLTRLRLFDAQGAKTLLERAIAVDPSFPLAHSALSSAWSALGYDERAKAAAKAAYDSSERLGREDRLWVEGRYRETTNEREKAIEAYRTLFGFFPDNLEYGLRLAAAQSGASNPKEALVTIDRLRKLTPPASDDPRIDLAEATAARSLSDFKRQQALATRAAEKGRALGATLVVASARLSEGLASEDLGDGARAKTAIEEARREFAKVGDRGAEANALRSLAIVLRGQGDLAGARSMYETALATSREIGDRLGTGLALNNIANVQRQQGSYDEARKTYEEALAIFREIGDRRNIGQVLGNTAIVLRRQNDLSGAKALYAEALAIARDMGERVRIAQVLNNLANVLYDEGDLAGSLVMYQEALQLRQQIGDRNGISMAWLNIAGVLRRQGDLPGARKLYDQSLEISRDLGDRSSAANILASSGGAIAEQGDLAEARHRLEEALTIQERIGEKQAALSTQVDLLSLALEEGHLEKVAVQALQAADQFGAERATDDEIYALVVAARAQLAVRSVHEAQQTAQRAVRLVNPGISRFRRFETAIVSAQVDAALRRFEAAMMTLHGVLAEARGVPVYELEARLAIGETELAARRATARETLAAVQKEATAKGFMLIARKAAQRLE